MVIQTGNESISDVQWSIKNSTVFATCSVDGRLEVRNPVIIDRSDFILSLLYLSKDRNPNSLQDLLL